MKNGDFFDDLLQKNLSILGSYAQKMAEFDHFYLNITYFKRIFSKKYNFFPKMPRIIAAISVVVKFFP